MPLCGADDDVVFQKNALASEVYEQVFYSLDLEERDYFGLQFTDHYHVHVGACTISYSSDQCIRFAALCIIPAPRVGNRRLMCPLCLGVKWSLVAELSCFS